MVPLEDSTPKADSPPVNSELKRRQSSTAQSQVPLLENLTAFAQSIKSSAILDFRRDVTKRQAIGQQRERERQLKFKSTFLTLIEDGESRAEETEKAFLEVEKQTNLSSQIQSKIAVTLTAQLLEQSDSSKVSSSARDRTHLSDQFADVKADLKATMKEVDSLKREAGMPSELRNKLGGLATKDELRGLVDRDEIRRLITKDDLFRITTDEVPKHVTEALLPTEKKLASLDSQNQSMKQKMGDVEAFMHERYKTFQEKDREQSSRLVHLETTANDLQGELSRLMPTIQSIQDQNRDYAAVMVNIGAHDKVLTDLNNHVRVGLSNDIPSLDTLVMNNSNQIQSLQQKCEKLNERLSQMKDLQAASESASSSQGSKAPVGIVTNLAEDIKLIWSDLGLLKAEQKACKLIQQDIDTFKAEKENVVLMRTDLDSLIKEEKFKDAGVVEGFEKIEESMKQQHQKSARLDTEIRLVKQQLSQPIANHPPTPPPVGASTNPPLSDQQKLQELEQNISRLKKDTEAVHLLVVSQQQKFDGLRTDDIVRSMVQQMQLIYPNQPGIFVSWKANIDQYISGTLQNQIQNLYFRIDSAANTQGHHIIKFNAELKKEMQGLRQDIEVLRSRPASFSVPQGHPDHGTRINELVERVAVMENVHVKAMSKLQANPTTLIRDVSQLQHQDGISSNRNTPRQFTFMSRSSKSNEPDRSPVNFSKESDSSDTPLSRRADRGVRRDGEDGPHSNPDLKRRATMSDDETEDEGGEAGATAARKVHKRRNVSGHNPFM